MSSHYTVQHHTKIIIQSHDRKHLFLSRQLLCPKNHLSLSQHPCRSRERARAHRVGKPISIKRPKKTRHARESITHAVANSSTSLHTQHHTVCAIHEYKEGDRAARNARREREREKPLCDSWMTGKWGGCDTVIPLADGNLDDCCWLSFARSI